MKYSLLIATVAMVGFACPASAADDPNKVLQDKIDILTKKVDVLGALASRQRVPFTVSDALPTNYQYTGNVETYVRNQAQAICGHYGAKTGLIVGMQISPISGHSKYGFTVTCWPDL